MPKKNVVNHAGDLEPADLDALKATLKEFLDRLGNIDNEIETLKDDRKNLIEEFSEKLDMKTLQAALRVVKIEQGVAHRDTYDCFIDVLKDPTT